MRPASGLSRGAKRGPDVADTADKLEFQSMRVTEMHEEDAEGWSYRGEGAANIVLAYNGHRPSFVSFSTSSKCTSDLKYGMYGSNTHNMIELQFLTHLHILVVHRSDGELVALDTAFCS